MASTVLNVSQELRMTDTSFESSYDKSTTLTGTDTNTTMSDDEDDELLALRIAALESIKLQKSKPQAAKSASRSPETEKPDFVIKSHPKRSNLLSIVTCEDEQESGLPAKRSSPSPAPAPLPFFDPTRPPPGFVQNRFSRSPFSRRSRSPLYRRFVSRSRSRSPGRRPWSRSPPPHYGRRRSISPYRRRRSFSRSPARRSPPKQRSPSPSPPITPSGSEWETDTESEEEPESDQKEEVKSEENQEEKDNEEPKPETENVSKKPVNKSISQDDEAEDILKLDATSEEDEFSAFLNEFEDEVLSKKEPAKDPKKKEKKDRQPTEKKVVEGKRLRKKIKPKKATPPPACTARLGRSPGRKYFSPNRNREGKFSPRRKEERGSQDRPRKSRERNTKSREKTFKDEKPVESAVDREHRERKEYENRVAMLPTPEREMMEARRKKFEKKIDVSKKISLKSEKTEELDLRLDIRRRISGGKDVDNQAGPEAESPQPRKRVTDLRVQLHKKRKAQDGEVERGVKRPGPRAVSVSPERSEPADPDEEAFGPVESSGRRRVVAPGARVKAKLKHSEDESDRSPSPLPKVQTRKMKHSVANNELQDSGLKGRRILVVRKERNSSPEPENFRITPHTSPSQVSTRKGIKKSLHLRLGGKVDGYSESDIYVEMLKVQEDKKMARKMKKEKKALKKEKKAKKSKKHKGKDSEAERSEEEPLDSDEELYRFFEEPAAPPPLREAKKSSKRRSGDRDRNSSGEKPQSKKRIVRAKVQRDNLDLESEELDIGKRMKSKRRSSNEGLDGESADLLERMRKKNEKRLKRMREIEQDKLMFA